MRECEEDVEEEAEDRFYAASKALADFQKHNFN